MDRGSAERAPPATHDSSNARSREAIPIARSGLVQQIESVMLKSGATMLSSHPATSRLYPTSPGSTPDTILSVRLREGTGL